MIEVPASVRVPDLGRRLPAQIVAGVSSSIGPAEGQLVLAEALGHGQIDLVSGRGASLYPGDRLWVAIGRYDAPLAVSGTLPARWGEAALLSRAGIAGIPAQSARRAAEPTPLKLIGAAIDAEGQPVTLARLGLPHTDAMRPLNTIAVISAVRGARSGALAASVVRGFHRMGLRSATAKPIGVLDAGERWSFIDAGASEALDLADVGSLSAAGRSGAELCALSQRLLSRLGASGVEAGVLRVAGGLAVPEVEALLSESAFRAQIDGVVLAAADALSACEGARRLATIGLPLIAVSGALARSPLATREAQAGLDCPVLAPQDLAQPATLQRLLCATLRRGPAVVHKLRLAA